MRRNTDKSLPMNNSYTPLIAGTFNDWHFEKMQEVVKFCQNSDYEPPNFLQECVNEGLINGKAVSIGKLNTDQKQVFDEYKTNYYKENWQTVLMRNMRYKKPMVANAHQLTLESLKVDPNSPVYIHLAWIKPGRHTYVVNQASTKIAKNES